MTDQGAGPQKEIDYRRLTILGLAGVIVIIFVIFVAQNSEDAEVNFINVDFTMPLWLLVAISMVAGAVLWSALSWVRRRRRRAARLREEG